MKILNTDQIRDIERYTIFEEGIPEIELMERAAFAFVESFQKKNNNTNILVIAGTKNNGGDGLAIARLLHTKKYKVEVFIIKSKSTPSPSFQTNLQKIEPIIPVSFFTPDEQLPTIPENTTLIDALFGIGLSTHLSGSYTHLIHQINNFACKKIAVDIPSGLVDGTPHNNAPIVRCDYTISFHIPKLSFFFPENEPFIGKWETIPIGYNEKIIQNTPSAYSTIEQKAIQQILPIRNTFFHKGNAGRVLLSSGCFGKMGATILCARSIMRAGAGLLTIHSPLCGYEILQTAIPEAMVLPDSDAKKCTNTIDTRPYNTVAVGPGLGTATATANMLKNVFENTNTPMVIDADALNIISKNKEMLYSIPHKSILTPHLLEFERIAGVSKNEYDRLERQTTLAQKYNIILILKGAYTCVCLPDGNVFFNTTGNPGMATAGSGDVLTGIISALLAQKVSPADASLAGVFIHGLAGDIAKKEKTEYGIIASDIIENIPHAFAAIHNDEC